MGSIGENDPMDLIPLPAQKVWAYLSDLRNWGPLLSDKDSFPGERIIETPPPYAVGGEVLGTVNTGSAIVRTTWTVLEMEPGRGRIVVKVHPNKAWRFIELVHTCTLQAQSANSTAVQFKVEWEWVNPLIKLVTAFFPLKRVPKWKNRFVERLRKELRC